MSFISQFPQNCAKKSTSTGQDDFMDWKLLPIFRNQGDIWEVRMFPLVAERGNHIFLKIVQFQLHFILHVHSAKDQGMPYTAKADFMTCGESPTNGVIKLGGPGCWPNTVRCLRWRRWWQVATKWPQATHWNPPSENLVSSNTKRTCCPQFSGQFWPRLAPELLGLVIGLELVLKILLRWIT